VQTLYSYIYIKSDTLGTLNWGLLSPASDNPAVLADISGTVIESNAVWFEGASFFMRPKVNVVKGYGGLNSAIPWTTFLQCHGLGAGLGADCFGAAQPAVRYDSPTWGGFRFETSWGKQALTSGGCGEFIFEDGCNPTPEYNFWDVAVFYTGDWNSIKLSAAAAYTWQESANNSGTFFNVDGFVPGPGPVTLPVNLPGAVYPGSCSFFGPCFQDLNTLSSSELFQIGASIMHKPSGLGIYGMYQHEEAGGRAAYFVGVEGTGPIFDSVIFTQHTPDTDVWYVKPFWRKAWSPIGATVLYGEYGNYNNQFSAFQSNFCGAFSTSAGTNINTFCNTVGFDPSLNSVFVTGSEVERYGLGVVQEIDSAAMHLFARWQHQEADIEFTGFSLEAGPGGISTNRSKVKQSFDDWDLFQIGGVIFF
jgi:hypothetical protein